MLGSNSLLWKDWCWSWNSNILATCYEELTHWKRPWCWERLKAGGEGDDRRWDGWMASLTQWTWVWVNSGHWWWTGKPGMLHSMGLQSIEHDWATELNWTRWAKHFNSFFFIWLSNEIWKDIVLIPILQWGKLSFEDKLTCQGHIIIVS